MREFIMIFRGDKDKPKPSPEQMQQMVVQWQNWIGNIAAQGKFVATNALGFEGRTVNTEGVVSDGPYTELKEIIGGYLILRADTLDEAVAFTEGCPTLTGGGTTVEVRDIMSFEM
jgi:hypothetical protein